jgi:hypothetical protein
MSSFHLVIYSLAGGAAAGDAMATTVTIRINVEKEQKSVPIRKNELCQKVRMMVMMIQIRPATRYQSRRHHRWILSEVLVSFWRTFFLAHFLAWNE